MSNKRPKLVILEPVGKSNFLSGGKCCCLELAILHPLILIPISIFLWISLYLWFCTVQSELRIKCPNLAYYGHRIRPTLLFQISLANWIVNFNLSTQSPNEIRKAECVFGMPTKNDFFLTDIIFGGHPKQIFGPSYFVRALGKVRIVCRQDNFLVIPIFYLQNTWVRYLFEFTKL